MAIPFMDLDKEFTHNFAKQLKGTLLMWNAFWKKLVRFSNERPKMGGQAFLMREI
jgi:hypothetical protein